MIILANAYVIVVIGILLAKAAGFMRDIIFGAHFGTGGDADIYFQIFGIASLVFTSVGSALSTLIIKNINKTKYASDEAQKSYASYFIRHISALIIFITVLMYVFARPIVRLLLPGIGEEETLLAVKLMYIMLPSFLFITVAYMMSGLLQNKRVFFIPSVMSLPYNVAAICALVFGVDDIVKISYITTLGWFLHIVVLAPSFYKKGYRFFAKNTLCEHDGELKNTIETIFIFISGMMFQLCFIIDKMSVSYEVGMVSTITYASNLFITISGVFVVAMSSVVFPAISQNFEHGEMKYVCELIRYIIKIMMSIFAFYLVCAVFFGRDAIALLYERGNFTSESTKAVSTAFAIYSFGIFGYLAQNILNKVLYIAGKYKVTVIGTLVTLSLKIVLDIFAVPRFGANSAAVTTTILLTLYAVCVAFALRGVIGNYITKNLLVTVGKILLSTVVSIVVLVLCKLFLPQLPLPEKLTFLPYAFIAFIAYAVMMWILGVLKDLLATPLSKMK